MSEISGSATLDVGPATTALARLGAALRRVGDAGRTVAASTKAGLASLAAGAQAAAASVQSMAVPLQNAGKQVKAVGQQAARAGGQVGGLIGTLVGPLGLSPGLAAVGLAAIAAGAALRVWEARTDRAIAVARMLVRANNEAADSFRKSQAASAARAAGAGAGERAIAAVGAGGIRDRLETLGVGAGGEAAGAAVAIGRTNESARQGAEAAAVLLAQSGRMSLSAAAQAIEGDRGLQAMLSGGADPEEVAARIATRQAGRLIRADQIRAEAAAAEADPTVRAQNDAQARFASRTARQQRAGAPGAITQRAGEQAAADAPLAEAIADSQRRLQELDRQRLDIEARRQAMEDSKFYGPDTSATTLFDRAHWDRAAGMFGGGTRGEMDQVARAVEEQTRILADLLRQQTEMMRQQSGGTLGGGQ